MTAPVLDLGPRVETGPPTSRGNATDSQSGEKFEDVLRSSEKRQQSKSDGSADDAPDQTDRASGHTIAQPDRPGTKKSVDDTSKDGATGKSDSADKIDAEHAKHAVVWAVVESHVTAAHQKSASAVDGAAGKDAAALKGDKALGMTSPLAGSDAEADSDAVAAGKDGKATAADGKATVGAAIAGSAAVGSAADDADGDELPATVRTTADAESDKAAADKTAAAKTAADKAHPALTREAKAGLVATDGDKARAAGATAAERASATGGASTTGGASKTATSEAAAKTGSFDAELAERQDGAASRSAKAGDAKAGDARATAQTATSATNIAVATPAADATTAAAAGAANSVAPTSAAATTAMAAPISAAPAPSAMMQPEISAALAQLRGQVDGNYQLRVSVHPAELGAVDITATIRGGTLTVMLHADSTAHQAVSQALAQLREQLADSGFTGVDVSLGDPQAQGDDDADTSRTQNSRSENNGPDTELSGNDPAHGPQLTGPARGYDRFL